MSFCIAAEILPPVAFFTYSENFSRGIAQLLCKTTFFLKLLFEPLVERYPRVEYEKNPSVGSRVYLGVQITSKNEP